MGIFHGIHHQVECISKGEIDPALTPKMASLTMKMVININLGGQHVSRQNQNQLKPMVAAINSDGLVLLTTALPFAKKKRVERQSFYSKVPYGKRI